MENYEELLRMAELIKKEQQETRLLMTEINESIISIKEDLHGTESEDGIEGHLNGIEGNLKEIKINMAEGQSTLAAIRTTVSQMLSLLEAHNNTYSPGKS